MKRIRKPLKNPSKEQVGVYAGGQDAYDHWANSLLDETQFPRNAVMPMLFERIMCQCDATCMIGEPLVRKELAKCIMEAKKLDYSGCEVLKEIVEII